MDRFRELSVFVAVAEEGAFNGAARRIGASPPAVTRLINGLEGRLGVRLLTRTTRQAALTEAGLRLLEDARRILGDLEAAEASAAGAHTAPRGLLRVTTPVQFGQRFVAPILRDFLDAHPAVTAELLFVDRIVDLIGEGFDVAVRIGDLPDSGLQAVRVGAVRRITLAAPAYLRARGAPVAPDELSAHRIIDTGPPSGGRVWDFVGARARHSVRVTAALRVNTIQAGIDAARAGFGITRLLSYQVADALAAGDLVEVLAAHEDRDLPIHLVHTEGRRPEAKIRAFIDLAAERLRAAAGRLAAR